MNASQFRNYISQQIQETVKFSSSEKISRKELKEIIKETLRTILREMEEIKKKKKKEEEPLEEMTTTSAVEPINLPGNVRGGWVSPRGGSKRGVAGSDKLGYHLTPIGKQEMNRKRDPS